MNSAECENSRNVLSSVIERQRREQGKRWVVQVYQDKSWVTWGDVHQNDITTHLNFLRSQYPGFKFRAVKTITVTYQRTLVRV